MAGSFHGAVRGDAQVLEHGCVSVARVVQAGFDAAVAEMVDSCPGDVARREPAQDITGLFLVGNEAEAGEKSKHG